MRRRLALTGLLLLGPAWPQPTPDQQAEKRTVSGIVQDAVTGQPIGKAALRLLSPGETQFLGVDAELSSANGAFVLNGVQPGRYQLHVSRPGFAGEFHGARRPGGVGAVLDLTAASATGLVVRLAPQGVITGRVVDEDGEPVNRAQVELLRQRYIGGVRKLAAIARTESNDLGEYRFPTLSAGSYFLHIQEPAFSPFPKMASAAAVYYPNANESSGAAPLAVAAGALVRAADVALRPAQLSPVSGRVIVEVEGLRERPEVRLWRRDGHDDSFAGSSRNAFVRANARGHFVFPRIPRGNYRAMVQVSDNERRYFGGVDVIVAGPVEGLEIRVRPPVMVKGRIRAGDGEAFDPGAFRLTADLQSLIDPRPLVGDQTLRGNTFSLDAARRDPAYLSVSLPPGHYVKRITARGHDVTEKPLDLTTGDFDDVDVLVSNKAATVAGRVTNSGAATVVLLPRDPARRRLPHLSRDDAVDQHGRFEFPSLPPGEYLLLAWQDVEPGAWLDPDFLKTWEDSATKVDLAESQRAELTLEAAP